MILSDEELTMLISNIISPSTSNRYMDIPKDIRNIVTKYSQRLQTIERKTAKEKGVKRSEFGFYIDGVKVPYEPNRVLGYIINNGIFFAITDNHHFTDYVEIVKYDDGKYTKINEDKYEKRAKLLSLANTETSLWFKSIFNGIVKLHRYNIKSNKFEQPNISPGSITVNPEDDILVTNAIMDKDVDIDKIYEKYRNEDSVDREIWRKMSTLEKVLVSDGDPYEDIGLKYTIEHTLYDSNGNVIWRIVRPQDDGSEVLHFNRKYIIKLLPRSGAVIVGEIYSLLDINTGSEKKFRNTDKIISLMNNHILIDQSGKVSTYNIPGRYYYTQDPGIYRVIGYINGLYYFGVDDILYVFNGDDKLIPHQERIAKNTVKIGFIDII